MDIISKKKDTKNYKDHPRVKIYYLRNDDTLKKQTNLYPTHLAGPSISYLSSLIQRDNNAFQIDNVDIPVTGMQLTHENQQSNSQIQKRFFTQSITRKERNISQTQNQKIYKRNAYTSELRPNNHIDIQKNQPFSTCQPKRFIKTNQQQNFPLNKNGNNQALQQDFLCNIVKEWNTFTEQQKTYLKKSPLKKWKRSIDTHHKTYKPEEIQEMQKNKMLMKEHFHLFLQNQHIKNNRKKQKSLTLLKAIFNRDESQHATSNKHIQSLRADQNDSKTYKSQIQIISSRKPKQNVGLGRRLSLNQKGSKNKYLRLLYGPEVKLVPKLFQQRLKINNFDWTKLDKGAYETRSRRKASSMVTHI